jgi:hypothetical protein
MNVGDVLAHIRNGTCIGLSYHDNKRIVRINIDDIVIVIDIVKSAPDEHLACLVMTRHGDIAGYFNEIDWDRII